MAVARAVVLLALALLLCTAHAFPKYLDELPNVPTVNGQQASVASSTKKYTAAAQFVTTARSCAGSWSWARKPCWEGQAEQLWTGKRARKKKRRGVEQL